MRRFFLIGMLCGFVSCGSTLDVTIYNKTGADVDSFSIGDKYIGRLHKDEEIRVQDLKSLDIQDGVPFGRVDGKIFGKEQCVSKKAWFCGTGLETVEKGDFDYDLFAEKNKEGYYLKFRKHGAGTD